MRSRKLFSRLSMAVLVLVVLAVALTAGGRDRGQFMFVDELQPGMSGTCKTVIKGNVITSFNFRIVDILRTSYVGGLPAYNNVILARAGQGIEEAGGPASGMSGSPCYINGKLIGALFASPTWLTTLNDPEPQFLIQPIEAMLPVLDACLARAGSPTSVTTDLLGYLPPSDKSIAASSLTGMTDIQRIKVTTEPPSLKERRAHPDTFFAQFLSTPVTVTGLSRRAFAWLKDGIDEGAIDTSRRSYLHYLRGEEMFDRFRRSLSQGLEERYNVRLYNMGSGGQVEFEAGPLEPGSPVGSAAMIGDISYGGYGTVTYVENDCLVAYGHPGFFLGGTDLFMTSAYIADTIKATPGAWKEGYLGQEIGTILEDRLTAIGGAIGRPTTAIQFNVKVTDKDSGVTSQFQAKSVALSDLYPDNLLFAGLEAVDKTLNRIGPGTLNMHVAIKGAGLPRPLEREDIYVSNYDVSAAGTFDPGWIAFMLAWNEFTDPKISEIDLDLSVERALRAKVIESVEIEDLRGTRLSYKVTLQPHRGIVSEVIKGSLDVSKAKGDYVYLHAFPARMAFWWLEMSGPWERPYYAPTILSLAELVAAIEDAPTNDLILVAARSVSTGRFYDFEVKSVGDWYADGERESEYIAEVK